MRAIQKVSFIREPLPGVEGVCALRGFSEKRNRGTTGKGRTSHRRSSADQWMVVWFICSKEFNNCLSVNNNKEKRKKEEECG